MAEHYRERIWPRLATVKLADIMGATGYSKGHCSTICPLARSSTALRAGSPARTSGRLSNRPSRPSSTYPGWDAAALVASVVLAGAAGLSQRVPGRLTSPPGRR